MKILIVGNGFIGKKLAASLPDSVLSDVYIESTYDVAAEITLHKPDVIINAIGRTGSPNIDWCEDHKPETLFSNLTVPLIIANVCQSAGVKMVNIGTGCIYEGGPYQEMDFANYVRSYYSVTKYLAETALDALEDVLQIRVRMPIDAIGGPRNLVTKLFGYDQVINELNSVTVLEDMVRAPDALLLMDAVGVYNVVNPEPVTHKEIIEIFEPYVGKFKGKFIPTKDLKTKAGRSNCVLDTTKLDKLGIRLRPTREALLSCARNYTKPS
jgi:dTDP-4-dehydrorhamnose reductase